MRRLAVLPDAELTAEQRAVAAAIGAPRDGIVGGPFSVWLRSVAVAEHANELGNALRVSGSLPPRAFELAVLMVARHWSADYAWSVHARAALAAGLEPEIVEAIRTDRPPPLIREDERAIYALASELLELRRLSQPTYDAAERALGTEPLIEVVAVLGFYAMAATTLVAFRIPAPGGTGGLDDPIPASQEG